MILSQRRGDSCCYPRHARMFASPNKMAHRVSIKGFWTILNVVMQWHCVFMCTIYTLPDRHLYLPASVQAFINLLPFVQFVQPTVKSSQVDLWNSITVNRKVNTKIEQLEVHLIIEMCWCVYNEHNTKYFFVFNTNVV